MGSRRTRYSLFPIPYSLFAIRSRVPPAAGSLGHGARQVMPGVMPVPQPLRQASRSRTTPATVIATPSPAPSVSPPDPSSRRLKASVASG